MQLFSADPTICIFKKKKIAPENMKKTPSKVVHNQPQSIADEPKTFPNHIFCSIKMSPGATSI